MGGFFVSGRVSLPFDAFESKTVEVPANLNAR